MPPQNMLLWHSDYFELNALEKEQMQEGSLTSLFVLKIRTWNYPRGRCPPWTRKGEHPYHQGQGVNTRWVYTNKPFRNGLFFHEVLPCASFPRIYCSSPKRGLPLSCHISTIYHSLLKWYVSPQIWLLLWSFHVLSGGPPGHGKILTSNKMCKLFPLLLSGQFNLQAPAPAPERVHERSLLPLQESA